MKDGGDALQRLRDIGALKDGHFLLSSGRHSSQYLEKFDLLRRPRDTEAVCRQFVDRFRQEAIDVVVGPTTGGILLAFEVARQLGVAAAYAERRSDGSPGREIRRGTIIEPGARVLVVDDILTTGGSVQETLDAVADHPSVVVAVAVLIDRSTAPIPLRAPLYSLGTLQVPSWEAVACPLCADGMPISHPGTTSVP